MLSFSRARLADAGCIRGCVRQQSGGWTPASATARHAADRMSAIPAKDDRHWQDRRTLFR